MKKFKTVAEFKRILQVGDKLHCTYHREFSHRSLNEDNKTTTVHYKDKDLGVREVSVKQTNQFAMKTWREKEQGFTNSWCSYPKASEAEIINDDTLVIYEDYDDKRYKILTYKFAP